MATLAYGTVVPKLEMPDDGGNAAGGSAAADSLLVPAPQPSSPTPLDERPNETFVYKLFRYVCGDAGRRPAASADALIPAHARPRADARPACAFPAWSTTRRTSTSWRGRPAASPS